MRSVPSRLVRQITQDLHQHMALYGYELIELPVIETADLFLIKAGDQVLGKLFTFERHGQQLALRPEFTAAAAHRYTRLNSSEPARWQFCGQIFEDDPNDSSRSYQRLSIGAELIGISEVAADAEIISLAARGLDRTAIRSWSVTIGHTRLMRQILARAGLDSRMERFILNHLPALADPLKGKSFILEQIDRFLLGKSASNQREETDPARSLETLSDITVNAQTMGGRDHQEIARRLAQKRRQVAERPQIIHALDELERWNAVNHPPDEAFKLMDSLVAPDDAVSRQTLAGWQRTIELLRAYQIPDERLTIRPNLARSWAYYTGVVFELTADGRHLGGGGRYDELLRLLGSQRDVPAVGFAYYADQILELIPATSHADVRLITIPVMSENAVASAVWANRLREQNVPVRLMPSEQVQENAPFILTVDNRQRAFLDDETFTLSDIDRLVNILRGLL
ncbi:MAG: ATP phosphoribosyltransferase regulatory subunit [Chloroflexi bacterium]|nr:ATP phosphoribosyltransferase regulatory subunit [Chloroflexota bacterium]